MADRVLNANQFKAHCLALLDQVAETGVPIVVTKRGRPIARLIPLEEAERRPTMGSVRLLAPDDAAYYSAGEAWEAGGR